MRRLRGHATFGDWTQARCTYAPIVRSLMQPGSTVDKRFLITRSVRLGAHSSVYEAYDLHVDQTVALKDYRPLVETAWDSSFAKVVMDTYQAFARIHSPHVVGVVHVGESEGAPYVALEWVDGSSLQRLLAASGPLPIEAAARLARSMAFAIREVHAAGFVHRDIKPGNVLVPRRDGTSAFTEAKLADFGIAGRLQRETSLTVTGQVFGTPAYMSPEQLLGEAQGPAADVYAFGLVLFEVLGGVRPYVGDTYAEVVAKILNSPPPKLAREGLPEAWHELIRRCLQKDPAKRPHDGSALLDMIEALPVAQWFDPPMAFAPATAPSASAPAAARRDLPEVPAKPETVGLDRTLVLAAPHRGSFSKSFSDRLGRMPLVLVSLPILMLAFVFIAWVTPRTNLQRVARGVIPPMLLAGAGVASIAVFRGWIARKRSENQQVATALLSRTRNVTSLSDSIAIEIRSLLAQCERADERILTLSMAAMVTEYRQSTSSGERQDALMKAVEILDKLSAKLSPWYVRREKQIAFLLTLVTLASATVGLVQALIALAEQRAL